MADATFALDQEPTWSVSRDQGLYLAGEAELVRDNVSRADPLFTEASSRPLVVGIAEVMILANAQLAMICMPPGAWSPASELAGDQRVEAAKRLVDVDWDRSNFRSGIDGRLRAFPERPWRNGRFRSLLRGRSDSHDARNHDDARSIRVRPQRGRNRHHPRIRGGLHHPHHRLASNIKTNSKLLQRGLKRGRATYFDSTSHHRHGRSLGASAGPLRRRSCGHPQTAQEPVARTLNGNPPRNGQLHCGPQPKHRLCDGFLYHLR